MSLGQRLLGTRLVTRWEWSDSGCPCSAPQEQTTVVDDVVRGSDGIAGHDQNRRHHVGDRVEDDGGQLEDSGSPGQSPEATILARPVGAKQKLSLPAGYGAGSTSILITTMWGMIPAIFSLVISSLFRP